MELLQSESLPSSLQPLLVAVGDTLGLGHMTAGDVALWANEQLRDMRRLEKHLQDVRNTVQPLKDRLAEAEAERERFRSKLEMKQKEFKQEMERHQVNIVQLEFSLRKAQRSMKETEKRLQEEKQQLQRGAEMSKMNVIATNCNHILHIFAIFVTETLGLEESNSRLKEQVEVQRDALQVLGKDIIFR